ncbi:hypothetical protein [Methanoculleus chikugoensis]|uniref:hypothetical protein n=1 Tax=Methanoculleus chikugoensis TaxID=118126 RepID=UPI0006D20EA4|nr:hypothetical protein [Methanoculleus chikugoensis]
MRTGPATPPPAPGAAFDETIRVWRTWAHYEDLAETPPRWAGEWLPYVTRAELTLKLLTMADSGRSPPLPRPPSPPRRSAGSGTGITATHGSVTPR